jgi:hypothetical protein
LQSYYHNFFAKPMTKNGLRPNPSSTVSDGFF